MIRPAAVAQIPAVRFPGVFTGERRNASEAQIRCNRRSALSITLLLSPPRTCRRPGPEAANSFVFALTISPVRLTHRVISRTILLYCLSPFEWRPVLRLACLHRSSPASVRGPVLFPPCILQRPFFMAGLRQVRPARVFAPHRAQLWKSPGGFPFRSQPRAACLAGSKAPDRTLMLLYLSLLRKYAQAAGSTVTVSPSFCSRFTKYRWS